MDSPQKRLLFLLSIISIFLTPTLAASRKHLDHVQKGEELSFKITLTRIDAGKNLTKGERIQRAVDRAMHRSLDLQTTMRSGTGEFIMDYTIGTPPQSYRGIMDTGSDLIWLQCQPCQNCFNQPFPIFNPQGSSSFTTVPCSNQFCGRLRSTCDSNNECEYQYSYGDGSAIQGYLCGETFGFGGAYVNNIAFGCSTNNQGTFGQFGATGIVGMGFTPLALPFQLQVSRFSYCLTSEFTSDTSTLTMGSSTNAPCGVMTTPIFSVSPNVWYFITCLGMTMGGQQVGSSQDFALNQDGSGGMMIDSGTTYTQIPQNVMNNIANILPQLTGLQFVGSYYGLPLCLGLPYGSNPNLPSVVFYLQNMNLQLSGENVWIYPTQGVVCLAMTTINGLGVSILGNIQQMNHWIAYDIQNNVLEVAPLNCAGQ